MRPPGNGSTGEAANGWRSGNDHRSRDDARGSDPALDVALKAILVLGCLAMLILLAASRLLYPLEGDGALFLTAARMMDDGGVLYVDFWDVKQPGIYFFYLWAGRMFGFTFEGVHLFQLVYWAAIGTLMFAFVRSYLVNRWVAILAPLAFLGTYYAHARMEYHAQVEAIANGPILLTAILLLSGARTTGAARHVQLALAGAFGATVVILKLALAPILIALFAVHVAMCFRGKSPVLTILRDAGAVAVGGAAVLAVTLAVLLRGGGLGGAVEAAFVIGPDWALNAPEAPLSRLMRGARWFVETYAFWGGLAAIGLAGILSARQRPLVAMCVAWIGAGIACILVQRFSWWPYQWQLLYAPVAILATLGADTLLAWLGRRRTVSQRAKVAIAIVALLPVLFGYQQVLSDRLALLRAHEDEIARGDYGGFREDVSEIYANARKAAAEIPDGVDPATLYVMGDPLVYVVLGKVQAVPVHGWALEFFSPLSWERLTQELTSELPEAILLMPYYAELVDRKAPAIRDLLNDRYDLGSRTSFGDWYVLGDAG